MKKQSLLCLLAGLLLLACGPEEQVPDIELCCSTPSVIVLNADETSKTDCIRFKTVGPWSARIENQQPAEWLSLNTYNADKAGDYALSLTCGQNAQSTERTALVVIECGKGKVSVTVKQSAAGEVQPSNKKMVKGIGVETILGPYEKETSSTPGNYTVSFEYDGNSRIAKIDMIEAYEDDPDEGWFCTSEFDYSEPGQITIYEKSAENDDNYNDEATYVVSLNEQGNAGDINVSYKMFDTEWIEGKVQAAAKYDKQARLIELSVAEIDDEGDKYSYNLFYTDELLSRIEYKELSDNSYPENLTLNLSTEKVYPHRYPNNKANIDFNILFLPIEGGGTTTLSWLNGFGILGKMSDCLVETGAEILDHDDLYRPTGMERYDKPGEVYKHTYKYTKYEETEDLSDELLLPLTYEFNEDGCVTRILQDIPYEVWEHSYEIHVGYDLIDPNHPEMGYEFTTKEVYNKKIADEKNTHIVKISYL